MTIAKAEHQITVGSRQRDSRLQLAVRCSLGEDFRLEPPSGAQITRVVLDNRPFPVRLESGRLIVPLHSGTQDLLVEWKSNIPLTTRTVTEFVRLPSDGANVSTIYGIPEDRWLLWAHGPLRGPAVRFWGILICSLLGAAVLGRIKASPLGTAEWMLLFIGLTQVPLAAALVVVAWLFVIAWRGGEPFQKLTWWRFDLVQILLLLLTFAALAVLVVAVTAGLLGHPEMFIQGNDSSRTVLRWYQAQTGPVLPQPEFFSVSIWWYRLLMLGWALWLATAVLRWLRTGWEHFSRGGLFRWRPRLATAEAKP